VNRDVVEAAIQVIADHGWDGLTLDRVAVRAGSSRSTLWRSGVTREAIIRELLSGLAEDYRSRVWPVLTMSEAGRERLQRAMEALFDVADRHLPLLAASDTAFHRASSVEEQRMSFIAPLARLLRDGLVDGSLTAHGEPDEVAVVLFNSIWTYVHLRSRHRWEAGRARQTLLRLLLGSLFRDG